MSDVPSATVGAAIGVVAAAKAAGFTRRGGFTSVFNLAPTGTVASPEEFIDGSYHAYVGDLF